ncbi:tetratricopeptide repeat protein [Specibacter sp. NPDC057265]|uniref:tetratricopeptide repeat protein n=1 Tax=Specibacter sp. NPDC057265 TaxID=3346075 RepID=UPI00362DB025
MMPAAVLASWQHLPVRLRCRPVGRAAKLLALARGGNDRINLRGRSNTPGPQSSFPSRAYAWPSWGVGRMIASWDACSDSFFTPPDDTQAEEMLCAMEVLVAEHPDQAVPLHTAAPDHGLEGPRPPRIIQPANSLPNIVERTETVELLDGHLNDGLRGNAAQGFLALAL